MFFPQSKLRRLFTVSLQQISGFDLYPISTEFYFTKNFSPQPELNDHVQYRSSLLRARWARTVPDTSNLLLDGGEFKFRVRRESNTRLSWHLLQSLRSLQRCQKQQL